MFISACEGEETNHIHGIAFDPQDGKIYLATHTGIEILHEGKREKIGKGDYDVMGFTISSDGIFYASGHVESLGDVGIRKSTDKGRTWQTVAYEGYDFHDISIGHNNPEKIYAWSTPPDELLTISEDNGKTWRIVTSDFKNTLFTLATDNQKVEVLYAGTLFGVFLSEDNGKTWNEIPSLVNVTIVAIADDPLKEGVMYVSTIKGILKTEDNGKTWNEINNGLPDPLKNTPILLAINQLNTNQLALVNKDESIYFFDGKEWNKVNQLR